MLRHNFSVIKLFITNIANKKHILIMPFIMIRDTYSISKLFFTDVTKKKQILIRSLIMIRQTYSVCRHFITNVTLKTSGVSSDATYYCHKCAKDLGNIRKSYKRCSGSPLIYSIIIQKKCNCGKLGKYLLNFG